MTVDEYGAVRAHALRLCLAAGATLEEAEDCVHEALVELLEVDDPESVRTPAGWVATVSRRRLIDLVRRQCRERLAGRRQHPIGPDDPADLVADRDLARYLVRSMAELPPTTREVCAAIGDGMSEAEVAKAFGLTARAVESHLTRARRRLRKLRIAVVIPVGVCCARFAQRFAAPLTCAAVAAPVAAVMLLPGSAPSAPVPHAEAPAAMTTTSTTTAVTTTTTTVPVAPTTTSEAPPPAAPPPVAPETTPPPSPSHLTQGREVVPHVNGVVKKILSQVPTTLPALPPLPSLPVKLPFGN
jgi:RNA polymerase sigma factor (sigma-70 family)